MKSIFIKKILILLTLTTLLSSMNVATVSGWGCLPGYNCPGDDPPTYTPPDDDPEPEPEPDYDAIFGLSIKEHGIYGRLDVKIRVVISVADADSSPRPTLYSISSSGVKSTIMSLAYTVGDRYYSIDTTDLHPNEVAQTLKIEFYNDGVKESVEKILYIKQKAVIFIHGIYQDASAWDQYMDSSTTIGSKVNEMYGSNKLAVEFHNYDSSLTRDNIEDRCMTLVLTDECNVPIGPSDVPSYYGLLWGTLDVYDDSLAYRSYQQIINFLEGGSYSIDIIAHSTGGLVTRSLINDYFIDLHDYTSAKQEFELTYLKNRIHSVTTIGTPHDGVVIKTLDESINNQMEMMDADGESWVELSLRDIPNEIHSVAVAGMDYTASYIPFESLSRPDLDGYHDGLVSLTSALGQNFDHEIKLAEDHGGIIAKAGIHILENIENRPTQTLTATVEIMKRDFRSFTCSNILGRYIFQTLSMNGATVVDHEHLRTDTPTNEADGIDYYCQNIYTNRYTIDINLQYSPEWTFIPISLLLAYKSPSYEIYDENSNLLEDSSMSDLSEIIFMDLDYIGTYIYETATLSSFGSHPYVAALYADTSFDLRVYLN